MGVPSSLRDWVGKRQNLRRRWKGDARALIAKDERGAYYTAQRLAARARGQGNPREFIHWAKVAAEVARLSPNAEMNMATVQRIADEELARRDRPAEG